MNEKPPFLRVKGFLEWPMTQTEPICPYKGLQPYTEGDRDYFFGRKQDQKTIAANLVTAPLTILYGTSGVGKTSVLQAGVVPFLQELPNVMVVVFRAWQDRAFLSSLKTEIASAVSKHTERLFSADDEPLDDFLAQAARMTRSTLTIILDQFEDYFLYHSIVETDNNFDAEFARAVNRDEVDANFLLSIREDSLAHLDRFQGRIPNLFGNYLRLEHLDRKAAREAIERPKDKYNEQVTNEQQVNIEPELVEEVLKQVKVLGEVGRGVVGVSPPSTEGLIEAPYLQLVMTRLWNEEMRAGSRNLRCETLKHLGGAEGIVGRHLDEAMRKLAPEEQDIAALVFHHLVTPSGTKIAHTVSDLAKYTSLDEQRELSPVLDKLSNAETRILRPLVGERYEIFHDVLAPAIRDWRVRFVLEQERAEAKKKLEQERTKAEKKLEQERAEAKKKLARVRLRWIVGLFGVLILAVLAIWWWWTTIEIVRSKLQNLDPAYDVPVDIALTLTSSDVDFIVDKFQTRLTESMGEEEEASPTERVGEEEEEEEEEESSTSTSWSSLEDLVEATYRLRLLKNSIGFVPESPDDVLPQLQKISSHEHYRVCGDIGAYFKAMEPLGIQKVVFFPTGLGPDNGGYDENMEELLRLQGLYSEQIIAFCTVDEGDPEAPAIFEDCLEKGGRGLKLIGGHPDFYEPENPLDSPTMMRVYKIAEEHHVPVVIHINMRKFPELQRQFEDILEAFPDVPFVAAHYCKDVPPFEFCAQLLDTYSNLYTDLSMGGALDRYLADISMHRDDYRNFILGYENRILWGADLIIDDPQTKTADFIKQRTSYDLYLLETGSTYDPAMKDTFQDIPKGAFALEDVQLFGLDLPEETLRKIYWDNPRRVLGLSD